MAADNPFLWWLPAGGPKTPALPLVHDKPGHLIRRAQQIAVAIFLEECAAFDLTPVQYAALAAMRDHPGIDATRISHLIAFDRTTISGVLERLTAKGLVERSPSKEDKRIKSLALTAAGRQILEEIEPKVKRAQERILSPLTAQERDTLVTLLGKLVNMNNDASRAPQRPLDSATN